MARIAEHNDLTKCAKCGGAMAVKDKRNNKNYIYRRRTCLECDTSVSTQEIIANKGKGRPMDALSLETRANTLIRRFIKGYIGILDDDQQVKFMEWMED